MSPAALYWVGRTLMLLGLAVVAAGFLWAIRVEAQQPELDPLALELLAVAVGFLLFTAGRWCAARAEERG